ncbi:hypothetical protein F4777DRAFT_462767 [Nemania sp. FL0916]|nr:hypothetical protein F4777DRAFT_462767 [Nemania sp. FL0916]
MPFGPYRRQPHQYDELAKLAHEHMESDLEPSDRGILAKSTSRIATSATFGSIAGMAVALYASFRLRRVRTDMFAAFRAAEKPAFVVSENGRQEAIPDLSPLLRPTKAGDVASYFFFGLGGAFVGGELGLLGGTWSASRSLNKDPAARHRIENAYRLLKADILRKEVARLESGGTALHF